MSISITTLDNGFRIVTENMSGLKSASVGIWIDTGGRNETLKQNGIAHFLEHMAFKGTLKRSSLDIAQAIENVGGYINAYTSREMTAYYARVLENDVPLAIDVISDILLNPIFDKQELETERGVILQEIGQSLDTPDDVIFDWLQETAYPDQPLGRTILGSTERVRNFSRDDLIGFVSDHYGPEQMVLSAAGAINHEEVVSQAKSLFDKKVPIKKSKAVGSLYSGGELQVEKDLEQAHFALAFEAPGYLSDSIYASQIYSIALGGGMSSRLFQEIREKRGLCYTIFAQAGAYSDTGLLTIYSGTSSENLKNLSDITISEMKRAAIDFEQAELDRARVQMKAGMLMGLESASSRVERLARMLIIWNRIPSLDEVVQKIDAVSLEDVRAFASNILLDQKPSLATYGPAANEISFSKLVDTLVA
ncbi:MAG: pitrilysin family protein [Paracoccaceae bacterium]|jgi:predicted Zn-dependent peptidase|nr:peptidase M16 [Paracoccaceae bacterium]MDG1880454.1 pitrilysin family protein [Paracoccaceae bacterium]MDG1939349.1 pitrilysin family protein [Paracoccaceae bacterium]|tara:strand:- start:934 stop:2196 length:1263 start_codon:yes stop_codon:yes gene_type:complete